MVLGAFEFPTMGHVWLAQRPRGAQVEFVEATGDRMPAENYEAAVDRNTLIVPVTGLCFMNGWRSEVKKLVALAHSEGALVMLDDYQDCGTRPVDVKDLDVDIYVAGTLKYLLGPPGLAMMYVRPELAKTLAPTISGWFAQTNPFAFDVRDTGLVADGAEIRGRHTGDSQHLRRDQGRRVVARDRPRRSCRPDRAADRGVHARRAGTWAFKSKLLPTAWVHSPS